MLNPQPKSADAWPALPARRSERRDALATALCSRPGCRNLVFEAWEETGTLCSRCAIEIDLFERGDRWDRQTLGRA